MYLKGMTKVALILVCFPFESTRKLIALFPDEELRLDIIMEMARTSEMDVDREVVGGLLGSLFYFLFDEKVKHMSEAMVIRRIHEQIDENPDKIMEFFDTILNMF